MPSPKQHWNHFWHASRIRAVYVTDRGDPMFGRRAWSGRYDDLDRMASRPIHPHMSVAPPWAHRLTRKERRSA